MSVRAPRTTVDTTFRVEGRQGAVTFLATKDRERSSADILIDILSKLLASTLYLLPLASPRQKTSQPTQSEGSLYTQFVTVIIA